MIRTAIIEDELASRKALKQILEEYVEDVMVVGEAETVKESVVLLKNANVDLVFMDIHLPDGESFEILEQLDLDSLDFEVIFITAYTEVKVKAFDYFFLQYLTKPFDIDKIEKAINHYKKNIQKSKKHYSYALKDIVNNETKLIPLPNSKGIEFISIDDIIRLEAERNYTQIHTTNKKRHLASKNIKHFEELLNAKLFFRVHKSHIIHIKYLKSVDNDGLILMADNSLVPLAKRVKKDFLDFFKQ